MMRSEDADSKSIDEIEGKQWPTSPELERDRTYLKCREARQKPISDLTPGDVRWLVSRDIALQFTIPKAVGIVEKDPLIETEHYKGDLLVAILSASSGFLSKAPEIRDRIELVLALVKMELNKLDEIDFDISSEAIDEAMDRFRNGLRQRSPAV